jgi:hypothetical protein
METSTSTTVKPSSTADVSSAAMLCKYGHGRTDKQNCES